MFMFMDPLYMLVIGLGFILSFAAQMWVKSAVKKWSQVPTGRGLTGKDVAQLILDTKGIRDVRIEETRNFMGDHYDPRDKTLRLSPDNYHGRSVAAAGIAAHEVGHAVQHADGYAPMSFRQTMVPVANLGTSAGVWFVVIGMMLGMTGLAKLGVGLFAAFVLFTVVTLPVEIDASRRATAALASTSIIAPHEMTGVRQVLSAAAATYLAAAVGAILQLVYWAARAGLIGGQDD